MDLLRIAADAADAAEDVISELFEAEIAAHFYVTKEITDEYAQRFIRHLYRAEVAADALNKSLLKAGSIFRAVASGGAAASVHDLISLTMLDVCAHVTYALLCKAMPDKWPPKTSGEHELPSALPCESDFLRYIDTAIDAFVKHGPTSDDLNRLSVLRQQELAKANLQIRVDTKVDKKKLSTPKRRGLTPAARQCAKRYKAEREAGHKIPMKDVILSYLKDNSGKFLSIRKSLSEHPEAWKVDTKVDNAGDRTVK